MVIISNIIECDFAAGRIIASEAGAEICSMSGNKVEKETESSFVISSNNRVNDFLVENITKKFA